LRPDQLGTLARAKIKSDEFTSKTSLGPDFHVTITGRFEVHDRGKEVFRLP